mmetsp:Transcript_9606/g.20632  ORF Transcript_9606/g.20632 Transcript_9606/m.20632 type:complete len:311 (+) Transcript_9606:143-1075(+)
MMKLMNSNKKAQQQQRSMKGLRWRQLFHRRASSSQEPREEKEDPQDKDPKFDPRASRHSNCPTEDDEFSIFGEASVASQDQEVLEEEEDPTATPCRRVRFNEDANQTIHLLPTTAAVALPLHYTSTDLALFRTQYWKDATKFTTPLAQSPVQAVLQQTHWACRQVAMETNRCVLSLEEEDDLLEVFLGNHRQQQQHHRGPQERQHPHQPTNQQQQQLVTLCGLEKLLLTHESDVPTNKSQATCRQRVLRRQQQQQQQQNGSDDHGDFRLRQALENQTRADRLYARLIAQATAYCLRQEEDEEEQQQQQEA